MMFSKKNKYPALSTLAFMAALFLLSSCGKPKDLKIGEIHNVSVKSMNLSGIELQADVPVQNPNGYAITIKETDLNLLADDKIIAHVTQTSPPITLAGKSSADHTVTIRVDLLHPGEIPLIKAVFSGKSALNIDGTVKLSSFVFTKTVLVHQTNVQEYLKPIVNNFKLF